MNDIIYSTGDAMNAVIAAVKVMEDDPGNQACFFRSIYFVVRSSVQNT